MSTIEAGVLVPEMAARKAELLPSKILNHIGAQYDNEWSPQGVRSFESANSPDYQIETIVLTGEDGEERYGVEALPNKIEAVVRSGKVFRFLDVGSGSYATLFTGLSFDTLEERPGGGYSIYRGVRKRGEGLEDLVMQWGFKPGRDFEMIAVNGGDFIIPEKPGLRLVTANVYDGLPGMEAGSVDMLTAFRMVYHTFGGVYLLEYFDSLLTRSENHALAGAGVVWPFEGAYRFIIVDQQEREVGMEGLFRTQGENVKYWHPGRKVWWSGGNEFQTMHFPVKPFAFVQRDEYFMTLIYKLEKEWEEKNKEKLTSLEGEEGLLEELRKKADEFTYL